MFELRQKALAAAAAAVGAVSDAPTEAERSPGGDAVKNAGGGFVTPPAKHARSPERESQPPPGYRWCQGHQRWEPVGDGCYDHDAQIPFDAPEGSGGEPPAVPTVEQPAGPQEPKTLVAPAAECLEAPAAECPEAPAAEPMEAPAAERFADPSAELPEFEVPPGQPDTPELPKPLPQRVPARAPALLALPAPGQAPPVPARPAALRRSKALSAADVAVATGSTRTGRTSKEKQEARTAKKKQDPATNKAGRGSSSSIEGTAAASLDGASKAAEASRKKTKAKAGKGNRKGRCSKRRGVLQSVKRKTSAAASATSGLSRKGSSRWSLGAPGPNDVPDAAAVALTPQTDAERKHAEKMYMRFFRSVRAKKCPEAAKPAFSKAKGH